MEVIKQLANAAFGLTSNFVGVIIICAGVVIFTGVWISYCSSVVYQLRNHVNAITLRKLEKLFRDNGDINRLIEILVRPRNDVSMVFYVCCRAEIPHDKISEHLNYKSFKYINKKIKPRAYGLFFLLSCVVFTVATLAFALNFNAIDWNNPFSEISLFSLLLLQIITASVIFFTTQYRVNACWQEFINLFASMQRHAHDYWAKHGSEYLAFSKHLIDAIQASKTINTRVESLISRCVKTGTYMRQPAASSPNQNPVPTYQSNEKMNFNNAPPPLPKYQPMYSSNSISENDKMMDRMMNLMQQSMQHNQYMNQQMQQAQMMQYNQMLQPGLQQHTMQNQIMMQNAQIQNMINQRFAVAATSATAEPPQNRPPMPDYEYDSRRLPLSMQRSPMVQSSDETTNKEEINNEISNNINAQEITPAPSAENVDLGKLEPFNTDPIVLPDIPPAIVEVPETPPPAQKKNPGKEVSLKPFETLNKEFKNKNPKLYVDKRFQAPVVFLRPNRESTRIEERLESIFHAKIIKYLPGEWEQLRPSSE